MIRLHPKPMQKNLHDGQSHKTKTWNKIWNTTALNTIVNSLRIHTALCSGVWPECNKGWKKMLLWMGGCKSLLTKRWAACANQTWFFPMIFKNKSSPLRRLIPIEILATRPHLRRSCTSKSRSSNDIFFLEDQLSVSVPLQGSDPQHTQVLYQTSTAASCTPATVCAKELIELPSGPFGPSSSFGPGRGWALDCLSPPTGP